MNTPRKNRSRGWNISIDRRNLFRERSTKGGKMTVTYPEENGYPSRNSSSVRSLLFGRSVSSFLSRPDGWLSKRQLYRGKNRAVQRNKVEEKEKERWRKEETGHDRDEKRRGKRTKRNAAGCHECTRIQAVCNWKAQWPGKLKQCTKAFV